MARRRFRLRKPQGSMKAWALAIALHVVVITALVIGFRWPAITGQDTDIIQAVAVEDPKKAQAEKRKREEEARKRKQEQERKRRLAEKRKKEEQTRQRKLEQERKRIEAEKRRLAEARKKEDEARRKAIEERRRKEQQEQQRLDEEKRRLAEERERIEAERRRLQEARMQREEEERRLAEEERLKEAEQQLAAAMAAEERERQEAERRARALTAAEKYKILIRQKVSRNWVRPPGTDKGLQCTIRVRLAASGDVLTVGIVRSSGNEVFDRSVENAVHKASPLPLPEERDLFDYFRDIEFLFNPEA